MCYFNLTRKYIFEMFEVLKLCQNLFSNCFGCHISSEGNLHLEILWYKVVVKYSS